MGVVPVGQPDRFPRVFCPGSNWKQKDDRRLLAEPQATRPFLILSGSDIQRGNVMKKKIDIAAIPELGTSVGMHGSVKQKEVGGPLCLGVLVAIVMAF